MNYKIIVLALSMALGACSFLPEYQRPQSPVANTFPAGSEVANESAESVLPFWKHFFKDKELQKLVVLALYNNKDISIAMSNVEAYQALYRIQRSELFPQLNATGGLTRSRTPAALSPANQDWMLTQYSASIGVTSYELDLFGRVRSLNAQALEQYFANAENLRAAYLSLITSVGESYFTLQSDRRLLEVSQQSLKTYKQTYDLLETNLNAGLISAISLKQAAIQVETARSDVEQYTRLVAQDLNALQLLVGTKEAIRLNSPENFVIKDQLEDFPVGLNSEVLLARPDIQAAEHQLKAANANIGAARAAFFPSISLTASLGTASNELSGLLGSGSGAWSFSPQINLPIFTAGRLKANLNYAEIQKEIQVKQYEKAIQTAFQEVANGLAARRTYINQLDAQAAYYSNASSYLTLAQNRYDSGVDDYLTVLDAQRTVYQAEQQFIITQREQLISELQLYKALGGNLQ
ncbi:efflux transporter outer membrane subunit [Methylobacillus pratensis]|uniref:efflux transporter outer membrane subunit n=1 Tax=Methylobacillus sp. Pita1 TaxID=3382642 RepID=UPI0038B47B6D